MWIGAAVAVAALTGLGAHFARVGLDEADKLSSVIGGFAGLAGLALAAYGLLPAQPGNRPARGPGRGPEKSPGAASPGATASGPRSVAVAGDNSGAITTGDDATNVHARAQGPGQEPARPARDDRPAGEQ
ncbi:hypothetical protein Nocox_08130 [Nonomuraea coxensis DSM 45129]|uniref:Uncharacterized protein n=1 Tax=Nonomuraea coxensis DSM 45129 TaxID=1122611 RepID=A0ABX8TVH5_9ACTN|nr:hypothetical protein Nocox_08130 [Nonomuraea coxensis DSM 45129]